MTRWYKDRSGKDAFFLDADAIESTMEGELEKARLMPAAEKPAVDVEAFIEQYLRLPLDQHADLPVHILGVTEFERGGRVRIRINRDLSDALDGEYTNPGTLGRLRATMAHEASHVVLHRFLYGLEDGQASLPGVAPSSAPRELQRCAKSAVVFRGGGSDWKEFQANRGMAALLMPRRVFAAVAKSEIERLGVGREELEAGQVPAALLARALAARFDVSCEAARIRLETLKVVRGAGELDLGI